MTERILLSPPDVGEAEREALLRAFDSGWIAPVGPELAAFEEELCEFVGSTAAVALSSGTAALHLGLLALGVEPGDEVVVQTATFAATAFAVHHAGARPVFCDVDADTWCLDPALLDELLTERAATSKLPSAVVAVDLYGFCPDYEALRSVCQKYEVPLLEDAAEALGTSTDHGMAGALGDLGVFSFNGNKIITTSGGGALVGPPEQVERVRYLATQARQPVLHYEHTDIGFNYRMSNLLAALGRAQLAGLPKRIERRQEINAAYRSELTQISSPSPSTSQSTNCWLSVGLLPDGIDPVSVCTALDVVDVEARPTWKPMHQQPVFEGAEAICGGAADAIYRRGICLPSGSSMSDGDVERVIEATVAALAFERT